MDVVPLLAVVVVVLHVGMLKVLCCFMFYVCSGWVVIVVVLVAGFGVEVKVVNGIGSGGCSVTQWRLQWQK